MVIFNLRERIFDFVLDIIHLIQKLPDTRINRIISDQVLRSATSIGANYEEADGTPTRKDFAHKMSIVKKEAKETKYWLKILRALDLATINTTIDTLSSENEELIRIVSKIVIKSSTKV
ncbi:four helix bundle protein [Candidatus Gottesmanbacteria bacterium]|nr:four helix bundle protein [Candidatus Gottesmanbacteria bacterium]